ncbi:MAG: winged helix-turn-helix domain-containing protein [Acidimicrobiales bacterium]
MDVVLLRWPDEAIVRDRMAAAGEARLLLVQQGHDPPAMADCLEDWIRVPASEEEVRARVDGISIRRCAHEHPPPSVDDDGVLRYNGLWVALPALEGRLVATLLSRFGAVVGRETLIRAVWLGDPRERNTLDVHVLRLRRRIAPLGLAVRTVRSRGYLIEEAPRAEGGEPGQASDGQAANGQAAPGKASAASP